MTQPQADDLGKIFAIPAENNLAERELRSLVIARKISFGSQSKTGLETRETLMSVL
ncbi:MAG: transposase, partial [Lentisphaerae bacterium]|nr:transposase [Lentisphaerota bacterium]